MGDKLNHPNIYNFTVTTTAQLLLRTKKNRKAVLIFNNGTAAVELLSSPKQVYGNGIPIGAGDQYNNDHFNPQGSYWIISELVDQDIRVEEDIQDA